MIWHMAALWETIADAVPDQAALINGETRRSWGDFERRAAALAAGLHAAGVGPDAKVALYSLNCNEYLEAHFAIFKARAVPVNVNYRYGEAELVYLLDNADAEVLIFEAGFGARVPPSAPACPSSAAHRDRRRLRPASGRARCASKR